jgi:hypothetical protein
MLRSILGEVFLWSAGPLLERFVPSPSWILRSLHCTEDDLLTTAGLDAVVFNRVLVFRCIHFYLAFFATSVFTI